MSQEGTAASSSAARADSVSETCVRAAIDELLPGVNLEEASLCEFRSALSLHVACPQGTTCTHARAAQGFFDANAETLSSPLISGQTTTGAR